ncbi:hypothetical protein [Candidatus Phytoplasma pruni]|uniref:Uncharacterized protein n=1 Tax=Candidatus Phytoplasma pruni TaxID=479893 RepID=A0A851HGT5_9MOLU|nr:hypothetical protein [Candidatus Phytoplasma pruni]NWN45484.1 hypothetical protein [Candidatus Phytoplasma pruni]
MVFLRSKSKIEKNILRILPNLKTNQQPSILKARLKGYDNMESDEQKTAYPPLFKNGQTVDEFEGVKNICPQGADYPERFQYKEEKDKNEKILKKT